MIDCEIQDSYNFQVIAEDRQNPNKKDMANVVLFGHVNENNPILSVRIRIFNRRRFICVRKLGTISEKDADAEANTKFSYMLVVIQEFAF